MAGEISWGRFLRRLKKILLKKNFGGISNWTYAIFYNGFIEKNVRGISEGVPGNFWITRKKNFEASPGEYSQGISQDSFMKTLEDFFRNLWWSLEDFIK